MFGFISECQMTTNFVASHFTNDLTALLLQSVKVMYREKLKLYRMFTFQPNDFEGRRVHIDEPFMLPMLSSTGNKGLRNLRIYPNENATLLSRILLFRPPRQISIICWSSINEYVFFSCVMCLIFFIPIYYL